jgi:hypothetical protein
MPRRCGLCIPHLIIVATLCYACFAANESACVIQTREAATATYDFVKTAAVFDATNLQWLWKQASDSNASVTIGTANSSEQLASWVRGKRLLFIGDSTSRNPAIILASMLCNPVMYAQCRQIATVHPMDGDMGAVACKLPPENFTGTVVPNTCPEDIRAYVVPLINLTMSEAALRAVRKGLWEQGKLPPMIRVVMPRFNLTIDVAEAGCGARDGLDVVMTTLLKATSSSQIDLPKVYQLFGEKTEFESQRPLDEVPFFAQYTAVVVSNALHCKNKKWANGWWYRKLAADQLPKVARHAPVVFIEVTNCPKRGSSLPDNLPSCRRLAVHTESMRLTLTSIPGVFVAPTREITKSYGLRGQDTMHATTPQELRRFHCPFSDFVHPSLHCYGPIVFSIARTVHDAITSSAETRSSHPECTASLESQEAAPTRGTLPTPTEPGLSDPTTHSLVSNATQISQNGAVQIPLQVGSGEVGSVDAQSVPTSSGDPGLDFTWMWAAATILAAYVIYQRYIRQR